MNFRIEDFDRNEVKVGSRVVSWEDAEAGNVSVIGTVTNLGEWDGDVNDEGRPVAVSPRVEVQWDDGRKSRYVTLEWEDDGGYPEPTHVLGRIEDVVVIKS